MAYNTKNIIRDAAGAPIPQVYNPTTDQYEVLQGRNGANRVELYGPDGTPIGTTAGKLNIRASEIESILTTIQGYVDGLEAALGEVQATPTTYTVLARLKTLEGYLDGVEAALGTQTDAEATGNGSLIAIVKRLRTLVGQGIVTLGSAIGTTGLLMAGSDGTNARAIKTTSDGTLLTQLTGRKVALAAGSYNQTLNVAAGGNTTITIIPPAGELWRIKLITILFPAVSGSTTGTHNFIVHFGDRNYKALLNVSGNHNVALVVSRNTIDTGTPIPADQNVLNRNILNTIVSNLIPLNIYYSNSTDQPQTGTLVLQLLREVEYIVS